MFAALALTAAVSPCPSEARFYSIYFGAESVPYRRVNTHTFAVYVRADADGTLSPVTVSWLPQNGIIRALDRPRAGVNLTLEQSLAYVAEKGWTLTVHGPYTIGADRYARAVTHAAELSAGKFLYKSVDGLHLRPGVENCVQAVRAVESPPSKRLYAPWRVGDKATRDIIDTLEEEGAIRPATDAGWLLPALGVTAR